MDAPLKDRPLEDVRLNSEQKYVKRYYNLNYAFVQISSDNKNYGIRLIEKRKCRLPQDYICLIFSMRADDIKEFMLEITKNICKKVYPVIKHGDIINVHLTKKPSKSDFVLISYNEKQWIDKYQEQRADFNC